MRLIDRINLGLALLLLVLLWANRQVDNSPEQPLLQLEAEKVSEIRLVKGRQLQLALLRDDQGWMITHPEVERAQARRVDKLLALLHAPVHWQMPSPVSELAPFGLDQPLLQVAFDDTTVSFGNPSSPPGQRYVEVNGTVYLIDDAYYRISGLPAQHFREAR